MNETKNSNSASNESPLGIDFELDAMSYALKDLPAQNKNVLLEKEISSQTKQPEKPQEKEKPLFPKSNPAPAPQTVRPENPSANIQQVLKRFPTPNPSIQIKPEKSKLLPILLVIILLACLAGGAFYYFSYFSNKKSPQENLSAPSTTNLPTQSPVSPPPFAGQVEELSLSDENLNEKIASLKQLSIDNPALKEKLSGGIFYQIKKDDKLLTAQELLQALDISLPIETASTFQQGWLFVLLTPQNIVKLGLVFDLSDSQFANSSILNIEKDLPLLLKNLFFEEDSSVQETTIVFQNSQLDARLRFFNFSQGDSSRTIDWAKIGDYLFFTTSKNTAFQIIPLLGE